VKIWYASARARWTLVGAVAGSLLVLVFTVLVLRPVPEEPAPAVAGPWEPPSAAAAPIAVSEPDDQATTPAPVRTSDPAKTSATRPPATRRPPTRPPATRAPSKRPSPPAGPNLSLRADGEADGSTKAQGRSFKDVRDGDLGTFWSPIGTTGEISIKWPVPVPVSRIRIREAAGGGRIGAWQVRNHDDDALLAAGDGAGTITFAPVSLRKITFVILAADGTPRVAEYETR
jgi:pectate lyase